MTNELRSPADRFPRLRRFSVLIIVAGGLAAWSFIKPHIPHDHPVAWKFDPDATAVIGLESVWTRAAGKSDEAVAGSKFNFPPGTAPRDLRTTVHAADGEYVVDYTVTLASGRVQDQQRVLLADQVAHIKVLLPEAPPASSR
jgi:hypothetical protein